MCRDYKSSAGVPSVDCRMEVSDLQNERHIAGICRLFILQSEISILPSQSKITNSPRLQPTAQQFHASRAVFLQKNGRRLRSRPTFFGAGSESTSSFSWAGAPNWSRSPLTRSFGLAQSLRKLKSQVRSSIGDTGNPSPIAALRGRPGKRPATRPPRRKKIPRRSWAAEIPDSANRERPERRQLLLDHGHVHRGSGRCREN